MLILQSILAQAAASSPVVVSPYPLYAWGVNTTGKLGINNNTTQSYHVQVQSGTSWKSFSSAFNHSLGVKADGTLWAWGANDYGQLGINVKTGRRTSLDKFDNTSWTVIKTDVQHSVGLKSDGSLWTWGVNASGQLGTNDVITRSSPVQIGTSSWTAIDVGKNFTVAVKSGGTLWAWGIGTGGQLGINVATNRSSPTQIGALTTWSKVAAGSAAVIASTTDNKAYVWGSSSAGNLILSANDGFALSRSSPVAVAFQPFDGALAAASSYQNTIVIDKRYRLWGWGGNTYAGLAPGQLGTNDTIDRSSPVLISSTGSWTMISAKGGHYGAIKSDGSLWMWGYNASGQLGTGDTFNRSSPTQIGTSSWSMVSTGTYITTALNINGQVFCWGSGNQGSIGNNTTIGRSSPTQIASTSSFNFVTAGNFHVIARTINNKLWVWGINNYGQLGIGNIAGRSSPVAIDIATSYISVSAGGDHSAGVTSSGTLWTWGSNNFGALGNSSTVNRSTPIQIGAVATWTKVELGQDYTMAMTESAGTATVFFWGTNSGRAGNGTTVATSSPVSVYSAAGTPKLVTSFLNASTYIITPDDTLIGTGENLAYALALVDTPTANTTTWKIVGHSPPGTINSVSIGPDHAALVANNALWSLGWNDYGQYMNGTIVTRSRAVLADSSKTWSSAEAGYYATMGITTDGKLWSAGYNTQGYLGVGDLVNRSSPTQVGTSSWTMVSLSKNEFTPFAAGVTTDGKLWGWGRNFDYLPLGVLGPQLSLLSNRSTPVQLGSATNWSSVSVEAQASNSLNDALIVSVNSLGEVYWQGNGTDFAINEANRDSPIQIGSDTDWEHVSAGGDIGVPHSFAIKTNKTLWAWGSNTYGNLGLNLSAGTHRSSPTQVTAGPTNGSWTTVAGGYNFAYGIDTSGKLWTWGYNYTGGGLGLGVGDVASYSTPQIVTKQRSFTLASAPYVAGGGNFGATVIDSLNNEAWSWGGGVSGITALGNTTTYYSPTLVPSTSWRVISSGSDFAVGVKADGTLWSWGGNANGQLGKNSTVGSLTPAQIMTGSSFTTVSAGSTRAYAISIAGQLFAWGYNGSGNAWNDGNARSSPVQIGTSSWSTIASGHLHDVGLTIDGSMYAWGDNSRGQHGLNDDLYISRSSPTLVATSVSKVFAGNACTSYIDGLSRLFYAGNDIAGGAGRSGPFFNPVVGYMNEPFNETLGTAAGSWTMVAFGSYPGFESSYSTALGVKSDGSLWAWGNNNAGTIGDGTTVNRFRNPQKIGSSSWSFVAVNNQVAAAIDTAGRLFTWGVNTDGKLGQNSVASRSSPVQVAGSWNFVAIGQSSVAAIKTDSTLWTWGGNANGQLGVNDTINRSSPVQVAGAWTMVAFSGAASNESKNMIGIKTNGQVYTWGSSLQNSYLGGSIGARNGIYGIDRSSPVSIGAPLTYTGISATSVSASDYGVSLIRMSDGNLITWGYGGFGSHGHSDQVNRSWPTVVGQTLSWSVLSMGIDHVAAVRSDGSLWSWGLNADGRLGTNDTYNRSSPVQVGSLTNWSDVSAGGAHTLARKTDGTLWAWGSNSLGRLGDGTTINKSSPIQIGTSSWSAISTGNAGSAGISAFRLFVWGDDSLGRLGLNTSNVHQSSPVQLGTSSWSAVSVGEPHMLAIRTDGALFAWGGDAGYGCLGLDISTSRSSPIQVGTSSWSQVSAGYYGSMGITTATSLWAWGSNSQGRLGVGDVRNRSVPTQVGALTGWTALGKTLITEVNTAIRGSELYAMGAVDSITGDRSSPVLVGVGDWKNSCTTQYYHLAIYNKTMILTEGHLNTPYVLGNNSTTTNSWNTSSRTIMEGTKGHRAYPDGPWSNNSHMSYSTTKAVKTDGTLWAWGDNNYYQIATKDNISRSSPTQIGTATSWRTTSVAVRTLVASILGELDTTGKVWTWGIGDYSGSMVNPLQSFTQIPGSWSMVSYARQDYSTQAGIKTDGTLWTWGYGQSGSTGLGSTTPRSSPTQVGTKNDWTYVASGQNTVIAIGDYGQVVYAWGFRPGAFSVFGTSSPVALFAPNFSAKELAPSMLGSHTMVLSTAGSLYAIGAGKDGAFGDGLTTTSAYVPIKIDNGTWKKIATGNSHTLGLKTDSTLWAWGLNTAGQLGIQDAVTRSSPVQVMAGKSFTAIGAGGTGYSHVIDQNGIMWGFGIPTNGVLGISSTTSNRSFPIQVGENWSSISAGLSHVALIDSEGGLWIWGGDNTYGQLGTNDAVARAVYTKIGNSSWSIVSAGDNSTHGITTDGRLWAWGENANANLGLNDTINRSSPTQVGTSSWSFVSSRTSFTAAISSTGKLWAWGNNSTGTLGDNTTINRSSPVQVTGVGQTSSFAIVKVGGTTAAAITIDGALYAWGTASGTGQNSSVNRSEPVLVSSGWTTDPNKITVKLSNVIAIKSDGTLWAWGDNSSGILATGDNVARSSPTQIGTSSWTAVQSALNLQNRASAIDAIGRAFAWGGSSGNGQLGTGNTIGRSSPTLITGSRSFSTIIHSSTFSSGIEAGTRDRYIWGAPGTFNGVGISPGTRSDPTFIAKGRVGSWVSVNAGYDSVLATKTE